MNFLMEFRTNVSNGLLNMFIRPIMNSANIIKGIGIFDAQEIRPSKIHPIFPWTYFAGAPCSTLLIAKLFLSNFSAICGLSKLKSRHNQQNFS